MSDVCHHEPVLEKLRQLTEVDDYESVLQVGRKFLSSVDQEEDDHSQAASMKARFLMMSAYALSGSPDQSALMWEETYTKFRGNENVEVLFFLNSAGISTANFYWESGNRARSGEILNECISATYLNADPSLRMIGLRATIDLSSNLFDSRRIRQAIELLTKGIAEHAGDLSEKVNEELCRAVDQRFKFLPYL